MVIDYTEIDPVAWAKRERAGRRMVLAQPACQSRASLRRFSFLKMARSFRRDSVLNRRATRSWFGLARLRFRAGREKKAKQEERRHHARSTQPGKRFLATLPCEFICFNPGISHALQPCARQLASKTRELCLRMTRSLTDGNIDR